MKRKLFIPLIALVILAGGCSKEPVFTQKATSTELVVPSDFNWRTSSDITVNVTGLPLSNDFFSTLVISGNDGTKYFKSNYNMRENLVFDLIIPATVTELNLTCGKRELKATIVDGVAAFSFVQKDDTSDIVN